MRLWTINSDDVNWNTIVNHRKIVMPPPLGQNIALLICICVSPCVLVYGQTIAKLHLTIHRWIMWKGMFQTIIIFCLQLMNLSFLCLYEIYQYLMHFNCSLSIVGFHLPLDDNLFTIGKVKNVLLDDEEHLDYKLKIYLIKIYCIFHIAIV